MFCEEREERWRLMSQDTDALHVFCSLAYLHICQNNTIALCRLFSQRECYTSRLSTSTRTHNIPTLTPTYAFVVDESHYHVGTRLLNTLSAAHFQKGSRRG